MIRCATYSRVSTDDQAERGYSLASQAREMRDYAKRKGYTIVVEHCDDGVSGSVLDRPALTALRDGVRAGRYDVVLAHAVDRLSRSLAHQLLLLEEFKKAGVRVEFATMNVEASPEGKLLLHIAATIGEYERSKIQERTTRGKKQKAMNGLAVTPAAAPFGLVPDPAHPGHVMIEPREARVIESIFAMLVDERRGLRAIERSLRDAGVVTRNGKPWCRRSIRRVLSGEGLTGVMFYNRRQTMPDGTIRERPRAEWIEIKVPQVVPPERVAQGAAQLRTNWRVDIGRPPKRPFMLRGVLRCSACGRRYFTSTWSGKTPRYRHAAGTGCALDFSLSQEPTERSVREAVAAALSNPDLLRAGVQRYEDARGATDVELRSRVAHVQKQIEKIRRDERRLIGLAVADGEQRAVVEGKLRDLA